MLKRVSRLALWIGICAATADFQNAFGQGYPYPWGPNSSLIAVEEWTGSTEFPSAVYDSTCVDDVVYEFRRFAVTDRLAAIRVARTWLRSDARATRLAGLAVLEWFGPDAVPAMAEIESLAGEEISIAELVRRTRIAGFVGEPGRSLLLSALEDRREAVVLAALRAVFRIPHPDPELLRRIASLSSSANERIRYWAALCCFATRGRPGEALDALRSAARDPSERVRFWATQALAEVDRRHSREAQMVGSAIPADDPWSAKLRSVGTGMALVTSGVLASLLAKADSSSASSGAAEGERVRAVLAAQRQTIESAVRESLEYLVRNPDDSAEAAAVRSALIGVAREYVDVIEGFLLREPPMPIGPDTHDHLFAVLRGLGERGLPILIRVLWSPYPPLAQEALVAISTEPRYAAIAAPLILERVRDENAIACWYDPRGVYPRLEDMVSRIRRYHSTWAETVPEVPPYRVVDACSAKLDGSSVTAILEYLDDEDREVRRAAVRMLCAAEGFGVSGLLERKSSREIVDAIGLPSYARIRLENGGSGPAESAFEDLLAVESTCHADVEAKQIVRFAWPPSAANEDRSAAQQVVASALGSLHPDSRWLAAVALLRVGGLDLLAVSFPSSVARERWRNDPGAIDDILRLASIQQRSGVRPAIRWVAMLYWNGSRLERIPQVALGSILDRLSRVPDGALEIRSVAEHDADPGTQTLAERLVRDL